VQLVPEVKQNGPWERLFMRLAKTNEARTNKEPKVMKKTIAAVAVFALGASLAIAGETWNGGHRGHGGGQMGEKLAAKLNLSDAQKAQMKDLQKSFREQNKAFFESAKANREQFRAAKTANDTAKLESLKPVMESQHAQMKQLRDAQRENFRNILTAEQQAQLDAMKAQRKAHRDQHEQQK
jgi:protein CpxP